MRTRHTVTLSYVVDESNPFLTACEPSDLADWIERDNNGTSDVRILSQESGPA